MRVSNVASSRLPRAQTAGNYRPTVARTLSLTHATRTHERKHARENERAHTCRREAWRDSHGSHDGGGRGKTFSRIRRTYGARVANVTTHDRRRHARWLAGANWRRPGATPASGQGYARKGQEVVLFAAPAKRAGVCQLGELHALQKDLFLKKKQIFDPKRPRNQTLMTPGDGPQRPRAAKPSRGKGPHTGRRPAQPRVAAHPGP